MKHRLTKEERLKGVRKALKNPRTPKQFLPGLRKMLKKLVG
jgi:hypothetical protein